MNTSKNYMDEKDIEIIKNILDNKPEEIKNKYEDFIKKFLAFFFNDKPYALRKVVLLIVIDSYKNSFDEFLKMDLQYAFPYDFKKKISETSKEIFNDDDINLFKELYDKIILK